MKTVIPQGCATVTINEPMPLFDAKKLCHKNDPGTSYEAAEKMVISGKIKEQAERVWKAIQDYMLYCAEKEMPQNFTAKELSEHSGLGYFLIQRRRIDLDDKLKWTGEKRQGCCVWRIKNES